MTTRPHRRFRPWHAILGYLRTNRRRTANFFRNTRSGTANRSRWAFHGVVRHFRTTLGAGFLVMLPIGVTIVIFKFFFDLLDPLLQPVLERIPGRDFRGLGFVMLLVLIYLAGLITAHVVGRRLVEIGHHIVEAIPVVKGIYSTARSTVQILSAPKDQQPYSGVVLIDFPHRGMKSIALVTAHLGIQDGEEMLAVFLPNTPLPTSGFLVVVPAKDVIPTQMSVDDAMKIIISSGVLARDFYVPPSPQGTTAPDENHHQSEGSEESSRGVDPSRGLT